MGKCLCQFRLSRLLDIQFALAKRFKLCCICISVDIFQPRVKETSYFPCICLLNAFLFLSFLPFKLQGALEESEKNAR